MTGPLRGLGPAPSCGMLLEDLDTEVITALEQAGVVAHSGSQ